MRAHSAAVLAAAAAALAGGAAADTLHFTARLSGRAEAPAVRSPAVGELSADLDSDTRLLTYKLTYQGLSGPATSARFHGPAKSGQSAAPVVSVSDTANPISGEASLTDAQAGELKKGLWYVNIATATNPEGEIRGQLKWLVDWGKAEQPTGPTSQFQPFQRPSAQIGNR
jgi:hypothetical protein